MSERPSRALEHRGERWRAIDAWRGQSGLGLVYFVRLADDRPVDDDRTDRRAALDPDVRVEEASEEALRERLDAARPLTGTERRIAGAGGDLWLVQNTGPVWAEDEAAADATGIRFRPLTRDGAPITVPGGHLRDRSTTDLVERLERARAAREARTRS